MKLVIHSLCLIGGYFLRARALKMPGVRRFGGLSIVNKGGKGSIFYDFVQVSFMDNALTMLS